MAQYAPGPKQLLPVAGKPVVEHTLARLPASVDELVFVVGGPHEARIRSYFGSAHGGRRVTYVQQQEALGLGHAVQQAQSAVDGRFLMILPDDIYAASDLEAIIREPDLVALAKRVERPENFGVLVCDETGCLERAVEKPKTFVSNLVSVGAYVLDPDIFRVVVPPSARGEIEIVDLVVSLVRDHGRRVRVREASFWLPVNDQEQLTEAERALLQGERASSPRTTPRSTAAPSLVPVSSDAGTAR